MKTDRQPILDRAEDMSRFAWSKREAKSNPWVTAPVKAFVQEMDRAGYQFDECNYPIGSASIANRWEQLFQWAESIAQNERDTARGF